MYSSSAYAPFGEQYAAAGTSDPSFTGQQSDSTSGLYDFLFRRLSQTQGRWISPDPAGLAAVNLANPQSWNRYSYVANSPLILIDQLGLNASYGPCGGYWWYDGYSLHCSSEDGGPGGGGDSVQPGDCADLVVNGMIVGNTCDGPPNGSIVDPAGGQQGQNTNPANNGPSGTPGCIATGLQSTFSGSTATMGSSTGEVGGHWNYSVQLQFSSFSAANAFTSAYGLNAAGGWPPPARFGSGPALHLENLGNWSVDNGIYSIGASAHIDLFNPNSGSLGGGGVGGLLGHVFIDGLWGHIVQFFGGNIDPKSCPYR